MATFPDSLIWMRDLATMDRKEFTRVVREVLQSLPEELAARLTDTGAVSDDEPTATQIHGVGLDPCRDTLLGLYEGVPLPQRGKGFAGLLDKISIFYHSAVEA